MATGHIISTVSGMKEMTVNDGRLCVGAGMVDPITGADLSVVSCEGMVELVERLIETLEAMKNGGS